MTRISILTMYILSCYHPMENVIFSNKIHSEFVMRRATINSIIF